MAKKKLERLFILSDEESYAEFLKLSPDEKREFEILAKERAEHYKKLTMDALEKMNELEKELKLKDEEIKRLKSLH